MIAGIRTGKVRGSHLTLVSEPEVEPLITHVSGGGQVLVAICQHVPDQKRKETITTSFLSSVDMLFQILSRRALT